jgi:hypothetical protein
MATTWTFDANRARSFGRPRAYQLTAAQAQVIADGRFDAEEQTFRAIVFALAQRMAEARAEVRAAYAHKLWLDGDFRRYLTDGRNEPATVEEWIKLLNAVYTRYTETKTTTKDGRTRTSTKWIDDPLGMTSAQQIRPAYYRMRAILTRYFGAQPKEEFFNQAIVTEDQAMPRSAGEYHYACLARYDDLRLAARNTSITTPDGRRLGIAANAPHWLIVFDALDFSSPGTVNLTLGQVRRNAQGATGAAYGASSTKAQAMAGAVANAAAQVKGQLDAAFKTPGSGPATQGTTGETATEIPWGALVLGALVIAGVGVAIYYGTK